MLRYKQTNTPMKLRKNLISSAFRIAAFLIVSVFATASGQQEPQASSGQFPGIQQLPASRLQDELTRLSPTAQKRAKQILSGIHFNKQDLPSLHAHSDGSICYACRLGGHSSKTSAPPQISEADLAKAPVRVAPFPAELQFNSRPGSPNVLWLNFEGQVITGTQWNTSLGRDTIDALPFSSDDNLEEYSAAEQAIIKQIWQRVAEDYAPFDINVTTERPAAINNRTAVCLITSKTDRNKEPNPFDNAGGVAFVNVFGMPNFITSFSPAFVYHDNLSNRADYIAEASSHEIGHNMGLSHDGLTDGTEYYSGHGVALASWGPIMGVSYDRNVSQWSNGGYYLANNKEDDLAIIANKVGYRPDDHGNTNETATPLEISAGTVVSSTDPESDPDNLFPANKGVLEKSDDVDVFSFSTGKGPILIQANPWAMKTQTKGGNLDILLELYDQGGNLLQSSNPLELTSAIISAVLEQGNYFLHVTNTGVGTPESNPPSGYTEYGSLGQYFLSGTIQEVNPQPPVLIALDINNGDMITLTADVVLNHTRGDGIPKEYRASEKADFSDAAWQPYSNNPNFVLGGFGVRTVYFQLKNDLGVSEVRSDTINFPDPLEPPILESLAIDSGAPTTDIPEVLLNHQWAGGLPTEYRASESPGFAGAVWRAYTETPTFKLSDYGVRTVYFQIRNTKGISAVLSDSINYLSPASILVNFGSVQITNGYDKPSSAKGTDFGKIRYGAPSPVRTFQVTNSGGKPLDLLSLVLPVGFILEEGLSPFIAPGASDTFTIRLSNTLVGTNLGQVVITNSDVSVASFQFRVQGSIENSNTIIPPDLTKLPDANPATIRTFEDKKVSFRITGSDSESRPITFRITQQPKLGKLSGTAPDLTYTPDKNVNGTDSFRFVVDNGISQSLPAQVDLIITAVNDPPIAKKISVQVPRNKKTKFRLRATDVDSPLSSLRFNVLANPKVGTLRWTKKGSAVYTPKKDYRGRIKFKYTATDGKAVSKPKTVTLIVR